MRPVAQLSLFSAEARPVRRADLAGLLCGPGRIARFGSGTTARLSLQVADAGRARAVRAAAAATGVRLEATPADDGTVALRSAFRCDLVALAKAWAGSDAAGGAAAAADRKVVPDDFQLDGSLLRLWALAAGRADERGGYLLALDPLAPHTHRPLAAAAYRAGISPARVGGDDHPALRISGAARVRRLVDLVGPVPDPVPVGDWPRWWGRAS
ncbi:hypothetical protein Psed_0394 [Pseudonocardia dioxanivorans CB1190]|uniref:Uncharacterized protein n=1 Tax=Pseudonocardia dioxanivorans (strain ATCC 55486 / DSM 44775 / JCM 13855 / CB1190) TaxID=675635 RepID=F4CIS1_PSEUX|nr:hypothetical protein Psed_0394 [Pseudonocardia dioxanivorans CB1190]